MLHLPNQGLPKANWKANSGALRLEMKKGQPIFDSFRNSNGSLKETGGFLNLERNLLIDRGWKYNSDLGAWLN